MQVAASLLQNLFDFAGSRGIAEPRLREFLGDPETDLCVAGGMIPAETYLRILEFVDEEAGEEELGLRFGKFLNLSALGLIYEISLSAQSVGQALMLLENYLPAQFPLVELKPGKNQAGRSLELHSPVANGRLKTLILDSTFCFICREIALMMGPGKAGLGLPEEKAELFSAALRTPIAASRGYSVFFPEELMQAPLDPRKLEAIEVLLPQYLALIGRERGSSFAGEVRKMILRLCRPELPAQEEVLGQFPMSRRTFQRRLSAEGTSFRDLSNGIKAELSHYLREGNKMKTKDIAYILGYSEPAAYLHAAKRW